MDIDLGDVVASFSLYVKGMRPLRLVWRIGAVRDTTAADRAVRHPGHILRTGRRDAIMDLMADKQVDLTIEFTDEIGNPVETPAGSTVTFTVDDPAVINLTDNGDGTAVAAATGTLGTATVHVESTLNGLAVAGDLAIVVVAGLAERVEIVAGEPTEVTPDA